MEANFRCTNFFSASDQGEIGNGRNLERQILAQQKCTKLCRGIGRSEAIFLRVIFRSLGMCSSVVPNSLKEITATNQRPIRNSNHNHSLWLFLCHNLEIHTALCKDILRIGAKFSLQQISPFRVSPIPNFPLPSTSFCCPVCLKSVHRYCQLSPYRKGLSLRLCGFAFAVLQLTVSVAHFTSYEQSASIAVVCTATDRPSCQ